MSNRRVHAGMVHVHATIDATSLSDLTGVLSSQSIYFDLVQQNHCT